MKRFLFALVAALYGCAIPAIAAEPTKSAPAPKWEPIPADALARFARDTTRAHQIDSVIRVQSIAASVTRQNAFQSLGEDIHFVQGDSVDLAKGAVKRAVR